MTKKHHKQFNIPVIDLFAGPGGLSEGFASFIPDDLEKSPYNIVASVEMDKWAHQTLELRSFFHEFKRGEVPVEYFSCLREEICKEELFDIYPTQARAAKDRAILAEMGVEADDKLISKKLDNFFAHKKDAPWVLIGGPPCQAYSLIGRSRRQANGSGFKIQESDHRNFLYLKYLDIIARYKPSVFIMENVKGMLSAKVKGRRIFEDILHDLKHPKVALYESEHLGYKKNGLRYNVYSLVVPKEDDKHLSPSDYVIKSEKFGIAQTRHRVILLGIRSDYEIKPKTLTPSDGEVAVESILADLPKLRGSFTRPAGNEADWKEFVESIKHQSWYKKYVPAIPGNQNISTKKLKSTMEKYLKEIETNRPTGSNFVKASIGPKYRPDWFVDKRLKGVINHVARGHMKEDLYRYFFAATYTKAFGRSPHIKDFPIELLPKHKNVNKSLSKGAFNDRFRVQDSVKPATTITSHISKDGHYNIHYDPTQIRSLTVREAARIQSFPDNYCFLGPRTQQYHQVGNAVPPLLAQQIADIVYDIVSDIPHRKIGHKNKNRVDTLRTVRSGSKVGAI